MVNKSEEVVVNLVIEQLKNMQDKLKAKEVVFKTIDEVLDFTKGKLRNLQNLNQNNVVKIENKSEKVEIKSEKNEKLEKIEKLENKVTKIVNQNVMNDNFSKSANKDNVLKDEVPSPSPKLFNVKVSFNASDIKSLTNTLFENVGKWQNQVKNQRLNDKKPQKIIKDDLTICL
jgi:hypothetical protein